jgi:hypothetical protein
MFKAEDVTAKKIKHNRQPNKSKSPVPPDTAESKIVREGLLQKGNPDHESRSQILALDSSNRKLIVSDKPAKKP